MTPTHSLPTIPTLQSKLPDVGQTIFTQMTALARQSGAINLAQGFPGFAPDPELVRLATEALQAGHHQYAPSIGWPALRNELAALLGRQYDQAVDPDTELTITAGGSEAIFAILQAVVRPGDEVVVLEPAYDLYGPAIRLAGGVPVYVPLSLPAFRPDWSAVRSAITPRTRLLITNTPHNPSGSLMTADDLRQLDALLAQTEVLLLSDEVYEFITFDGYAHQSALQYPNLRARAFVVGSFGKTLHVTGWRLGYCVAPPALSAELRKVHQYITFAAPTPLQVAVAEYLRLNPDMPATLSAFYQAKRDFFAQRMNATRFRALPCPGSYFQLYDYRAISDQPDLEFAHWLTTTHGVAAIPVSVFYHQAPADLRLLRFCFAKTEAEMAAASERLQCV